MNFYRDSIEQMKQTQYDARQELREFSSQIIDIMELSDEEVEFAATNQMRWEFRDFILQAYVVYWPDFHTDEHIYIMLAMPRSMGLFNICIDEQNWRSVQNFAIPTDEMKTKILNEVWQMKIGPNKENDDG